MFEKIEGELCRGWCSDPQCLSQVTCRPYDAVLGKLMGLKRGGSRERLGGMRTHGQRGERTLRLHHGNRATTWFGGSTSGHR